MKMRAWHEMAEGLCSVGDKRQKEKKCKVSFLSPLGCSNRSQHLLAVCFVFLGIMLSKLPLLSEGVHIGHTIEKISEDDLPVDCTCYTGMRKS